MNHLNCPTKKSRSVLSLLIVALISVISLAHPNHSFAQKSTDWQLEKMPPDLEKDYALSALPPYLRKGATVYLLDPTKGYYVVQKGTNGFVCYIDRTNWEWGEFRKDLTMPISFDAEGYKKVFPVSRDVAAMRASGKFTALQIKDSVISRIKKGIYKAPARGGISYMLAPVMRGYPGDPDNKMIMTMCMPHYMFYAPYMNNADIAGSKDECPCLINPDNTILGDKKGPYGFIILPAGETEKAKIISANSGLMKRLIAYKAYYKI